MGGGGFGSLYLFTGPSAGGRGGRAGPGRGRALGTEGTEGTRVGRRAAACGREGAPSLRLSPRGSCWAGSAASAGDPESGTSADPGEPPGGVAAARPARACLQLLQPGHVPGE